MRTRFLLLQHVVEIGKKSNTGRVAALALTNARLLTYGLPGASLDTDLLSEPGTWLLDMGLVAVQVALLAVLAGVLLARAHRRRPLS